MSSQQTATLNESEESAENRFKALARKPDNSRDNSQMIAEQATRAFIQNNLSRMLRLKDSAVDRIFNDQQNIGKITAKLKKQMAAVQFERMKNKKIFEEHGKYYIGKSEAVSKEKMLEHLESLINDELLDEELKVLRKTLQIMKREGRITNRTNNINRLQDEIKEAKDVMIKRNTELKNVQENLLEAMYKQDRVIISIRSELIGNEQNVIHNLQLDQSITANKTNLMNSKSKTEQTEMQNKHNAAMAALYQQQIDLRESQLDASNKANEDARADAAAQLAATRAAAAAQLDATHSAAAAQAQSFNEFLKHLDNINNTVFTGSENIQTALNDFNTDLTGAFDKHRKDFWELGEEFKKGVTNLTEAAKGVAGKITRGNDDVTNEYDKVTKAVTDLHHEFENYARKRENGMPFVCAGFPPWDCKMRKWCDGPETTQAINTTTNQTGITIYRCCADGHYCASDGGTGAWFWPEWIESTEHAKEQQNRGVKTDINFTHAPKGYKLPEGVRLDRKFRNPAGTCGLIDY